MPYVVNKNSLLCNKTLHFKIYWVEYIRIKMRHTYENRCTCSSTTHRLFDRTWCLFTICYENIRLRIPYFTYYYIGIQSYEFPMVSFRPPFFLPIAYCTTWNSITKIQLQLYIGVHYKRFFTSHSI